MPDISCSIRDRKRGATWPQQADDASASSYPRIKSCSKVDGLVPRTQHVNFRKPAKESTSRRSSREPSSVRNRARETLQGYLAYKKPPSRRTPTVGPCLGSYGSPRGGGRFLMRQVPMWWVPIRLYCIAPSRRLRCLPKRAQREDADFISHNVLIEWFYKTVKPSTHCFNQY